MFIMQVVDVIKVNILRDRKLDRVLLLRTRDSVNRDLKGTATSYEIRIKRIISADCKKDISSKGKSLVILEHPTNVKPR